MLKRFLLLHPGLISQLIQVKTPISKTSHPSPMHWGRDGDGVDKRHLRILITFLELLLCPR